ncbi:MAG: hypothetical protein RIQ33_1417, partial [Bacteroidota bacterium]
AKRKLAVRILFFETSFYFYQNKQKKTNLLGWFFKMKY